MNEQSQGNSYAPEGGVVDDAIASLVEAMTITVYCTLSQEIIDNYRCGKCNHWWSISDAPNPVKSGDTVFCPTCGAVNIVDKILAGADFKAENHGGLGDK